MTSRAATRRRFRNAPSAPVVYQRFAPRFAQPVGTVYNASTRLTDFTAEKLAWLSRTATEPTTWVTITEQGSAAANRTAVQNAIDAAVAASGTTNVDNLRGIRVPASMLVDQDVSLNAVALTSIGGSPRYLYIETADGALRGVNQRVSRADDAARMPKFQVRTYGAQSFTMTQNTQRVRLTGLHLRVDPTAVSGLVSAGYGYGGTFTYLFNGLIGFNPTISDTLRPRDIIVDRCIIEMPEALNSRRTVLMNWQRGAVINCWIENAGDTASDSQGILISSTPGDLVIYNNEIANARGQCIAIAGDPLGEAFIPSDWVIVENLLTFRTRWGPVTASEPAGLNRETKSAFQTKIGVRGLIERNRISNIWGFGRQLSQFHVIVIKASDDNNNEPWALCRDITVRLNDLVDCAGTITLIGTDRSVSVNGADHRYLHRVEIAHNINRPWNQSALGLGYIASGFVRFIRTSGTFVNPSDPEWSRMSDVSVHDNTMWIQHDPANPGAAVYWDGTNSAAPPIMLRFEWANNVIVCENVIDGWFLTTQVGGAFSSMPTGWTAADRIGVIEGGNFVSACSNPGAQLAPWPSSVGVATFAAMDLNPATLALNPTSPGRGIALGGGDPGVDHTLLALALARVATGRS
jgi:hypothetical protein